MEFNQDLDKEIWNSEKVFYNRTKLIVSVRSYNNATPKIQISRCNKTNSGWSFTKLGRLTKEETESLIEMLNDALTQFDK
ncbi:MAG: hypothetical protein QW524_03070 [Candidatus Woesearchaeota archaeon]